jgi:hypothetical protein
MPITVITHTSDRRPKYICRVCREAVFAKGEESAFERHVVRCAKEHEDELRALSLRVKAPFFFDPASPSRDQDLERWTKAHRAEILEDRKKM